MIITRMLNKTSLSKQKCVGTTKNRVKHEHYLRKSSPVRVVIYKTVKKNENDLHSDLRTTRDVYTTYIRFITYEARLRRIIIDIYIKCVLQSSSA